MSGWHHNDLTIAAGAPDAIGYPAGYVFDARGEQHVVYRGDDNHIHELWWNSEGWHHKDLNIAAGAPQAVSDPAGYVFDARGEQHVVYRGADNHIHELWWNSEGWHHKDLTSTASAPDPLIGSGWPPAGYVFNGQGTQHVVYQGEDHHFHDLWWDSNGWHFNDLTIASGAQTDPNLEFVLSRPACYVFDARGEQHVFYNAGKVLVEGTVHIGQDSHIHELWWNNDGWHHNDLNIAAGVLAGEGSHVSGNPAAYMFDAQGTQHVIYRSLNHFHELWWDSNGWHYNDLTVAASVPKEPEGPLPPGELREPSDPSGYIFDVYGEQHVVYRGTENHIHELWWNANAGWRHTDLTIAAGAPEALGNPAGYVFKAQGTQHVIYWGTDRHIHELRWERIELLDTVQDIFSGLRVSP
jgi:hypothetical protein